MSVSGIISHESYYNMSWTVRLDSSIPTGKGSDMFAVYAREQQFQLRGLTRVVQLVYDLAAFIWMKLTFVKSPMA
jgi:hypothetical protein